MNEANPFRVYGGVNLERDFDTVEEVHEFVRRHPDRDFQITPRYGSARAAAEELQPGWRQAKAG